MTSRAQAEEALRRSREKAKQKRKPNGPAAGAAPQTFAVARLSEITPNLTYNDRIKDILPGGGIGEVHADSSGGKTAIVVDMLLHLAAGIPYRGRRTIKTPVVYVALEGHAGIGNRIFAAAQEIGIDEVDFWLIKSADNLRDPAVAEKLAATITQLKVTAVIAIDTYTAALGPGASDCNPEDVTAFLENIKASLLAREHTVLLLHHFGKDASRGGRGWSGLGAALDFEWEIERTDDLRTLRVSKMRDGDDRQPALCYQLRGRKLGEDQYGDDVTAVVVEHLADEKPDRPTRKLTPKARAALNVLWSCIKDSSKSWPMADRPGFRSTTLPVWEAECLRPGAISRSHRDADRAKLFRSAKDELAAARAIVLDGEFNQRVHPAPKPEGTRGTAGNGSCAPQHIEP
jgi:hypothetical protein